MISGPSPGMTSESPTPGITPSSEPPQPIAATHRPALRPPSGLTIRVSRGTGMGATRLSAFDAALRDAGVADFNLIRLSSVIPPGATVKEVSGRDQIQGEHGDTLLCVYAVEWASTPHSEAWAGVAWSERDDGSGAGLFVEHGGLSETQVQTELTHTLQDLSDGRGSHYYPAGSMLASVKCERLPVCALVIATYATRGWLDDAN